jgi:hypothetical protein
MAGLPLLVLVKSKQGRRNANRSRSYAEEPIGYGPFADFPIRFGVRDFPRPILDRESQTMHVVPSSPTAQRVAFVLFPFTCHKCNGQGQMSDKPDLLPHSNHIPIAGSQALWRGSRPSLAIPGSKSSPRKIDPKRMSSAQV